jgi:hypothetical protein
VRNATEPTTYALRTGPLKGYLRRMRRRSFAAAAGTALLAGSVTLLALGQPGTAAAGEKIRVLTPTPFNENSDVPDAVREQCRDLGTQLPSSLARAHRDVVLVRTDKELSAKSGKYLKVEIVEVRAKGGGVFSGPKHITVRAILFQNGKEIADVEAKRGSTMAFSACSSLEKVEKAIGQDLGKWLNNPRPNDRI